MRGSKFTKSDILISRSFKASISAEWPRLPLSREYPRISSIISCASERVMGMERKLTSFKTSTNTPPRPNIRTGPKVGSFATPTMASIPVGAIFCTEMPSTGFP